MLLARDNRRRDLLDGWLPIANRPAVEATLHCRRWWSGGGGLRDGNLELKTRLPSVGEVAAVKEPKVIEEVD